MIEKALKQYNENTYREAESLKVDMMDLLVMIVKNMTSSWQRKKFPDPIDRYNNIVSKMTKVLNKPGETTHVTDGQWPRRMILKLVILQLKSSTRP